MTFCRMSRALLVQMNGLGVGVVMGDVFIDGSHEFGHAFEHPPAQAVLGDVAEEALDHGKRLGAAS